MRDGWYMTGDIAMMDEDGFIFITDRLSRFSKIGGEMVPHLKIEEAINGVLGDLCSAVTAVPDAARGERLVAFYTRADVTPQDLWEQLCETELPQALDAEARAPGADRRNPDARHRQGGSAPPARDGECAIDANPCRLARREASGRRRDTRTDASAKQTSDGGHQSGRNHEEVREARSRVITR